MLRFVKVVAMWLIALAIPVQGMAAVVMPLCAPAHHADLQAVGAKVAAADLAQHHHAGMTHAAPTDQDAGAAGDDAGHIGHPMLKCCSAACAMAAVMPANLDVRAQARSPAPQHPVAQIYRGITPDGLDRPPKSFLT
ncbi:MAG: hypothetical protein OEU93_16360 [Rubrivivax sp.]|nr:hypothetical protein [Rubrivivax sp.]